MSSTSTQLLPAPLIKDALDAAPSPHDNGHVIPPHDHVLPPNDGHVLLPLPAPAPARPAEHHQLTLETAFSPPAALAEPPRSAPPLHVAAAPLTPLGFYPSSVLAGSSASLPAHGMAQSPRVERQRGKELSPLESPPVGLHSDTEAILAVSSDEDQLAHF